MVFRLWCESLICAQKPKSAAVELASTFDVVTGEPELTQLDVAIHRQEDVIGFDITMNDTLRVQVLQTVQGLVKDVRNHSRKQSKFGTYLSAYCRNLSFTHDVEGHHIRETTTFHVLHHDPQVQAMKETLEEVHDVLVLAILHHKNLVDDQVLLGLKVQVHLLDSHTAVVSLLIGSEDTTRSTLADLV